MASENAQTRRSEVPESASENTQQVRALRRRGRQPTPLPVHLEAVHAAYTCDLADAPVSPETTRTYASKVRGFLAWLADADPLTDTEARDWAVRDWRAHLLTVDKRATATITSPPSTTSTPAAASARPAPTESTCPPPRLAP